MHSYMHNIKTFNSATRNLTRVERALYRELIELYYDTEQPLPATDFNVLARRVGVTSDAEKTDLRYVLSEFFEKTGVVYSHNFCDEEIEKYHSIKTQKANAGKASAVARKKRAEERKMLRSNSESTESNGCSTDVQQTRNGTPTNHEPGTMNHEVKKSIQKKTSSRKKVKTSMPNNFGISERVKAWAKKNKHSHLEQHLESFKLKCSAKNYQYVNWDSAFMNAVRDNWAKIGDIFQGQSQDRPQRKEL